MSPLHSNVFVLNGQPSSHVSEPREGSRSTSLCGPPLRRSSEHGDSAVRPALAATWSRSSARCGASIIWRSRAQRHSSRRKRRAFMWCARSANGPPDQAVSLMKYSPATEADLALSCGGLGSSQWTENTAFVGDARPRGIGDSGSGTSAL